MPISQYFASIGAPLKSYRWSWGAIADGTHPDVPKGTYVLRVDGEHFIEYLEVLYYQLYNPLGGTHAGQRERAGHVQAIQRGAPCKFIIVQFKDGSITSYSPTLYTHNSTIVIDGETYIGSKRNA